MLTLNNGCLLVATLCLLQTAATGQTPSPEGGEKPESTTATARLRNLQVAWEQQKKARLAAAEALKQLEEELRAQGQTRRADERRREFGRLFPDLVSNLPAPTTQAETAVKKILSARMVGSAPPLKSLRSTGELLTSGASAKKFTFVRVQTTNPARIREDVIELGSAKGWDGQNAWLVHQKHTTQLQGPAKANSADWAKSSLDLILGTDLSNFRFVRRFQVFGKPAWRFVNKFDSNNFVDYSVESGLPIRVIGGILGMQRGKATLSVYFGDWQVFEKRRLPCKLVYYDGESEIMTIKNLVYGLNVEIDPTIFQPPG